MASRTGVRAATKFAALIALSVTACTHRRAEEAYRDALAAYARGDLRQAAETARRNSDRMRGGPDVVSFWKFRLLEAEALTAQSRNREAETLLADPLSHRPELAQLEVRRLIDLANLPGHRRQAADLLRQGRQRVADPELEIRIYLTEGSLASNDPKAADAAFHAALQKAHLQTNPYWEPLALKNLSYSSRKQNRYEEAIDYGVQALVAADKMGARRIAALARENMISAYLYLGDFDSALSNGRAAVRIFEAIGARADLARSE